MSELAILSFLILCVIGVFFYLVMLRIDGIFDELSFLEGTLDNVLLQIADLHEQLADVHLAEQVTHIEEEVINSFDSRILAIKNELGLRVPIADTHVQNTPEILHPNVYNIDNHEHDNYPRYDETEIAR